MPNADRERRNTAPGSSYAKLAHSLDLQLHSYDEEPIKGTWDSPSPPPAEESLLSDLQLDNGRRNNNRLVDEISPATKRFQDYRLAKRPEKTIAPEFDTRKLEDSPVLLLFKVRQITTLNVYILPIEEWKIWLEKTWSLYELYGSLRFLIKCR